MRGSKRLSPPSVPDFTMAETTLLEERSDARTETPAPPISAGRLQIAQVLAFLALLAALVGALGPADQVRSTYSWPPPALPAGTPSRVWYTPLLLIRHRPETISATLPCSVSPLPAAERPLTVLATARFPERSGGLAVTYELGRFVVRIGDEVLQRVPVRAAGSDCFYQLELGGGRWSLESSSGDVAYGGALASMPITSGLFSALDLRTKPAPAIGVTTAVHAARPTLRQTLAWIVAVLCGLGALALVAVGQRPQPRSSVPKALRAARVHAHPADGVVGVALLVWWVLSPVALDDGWVIARERMFSASGGFSHYYTVFGANLPSDYWLEWVQHWLAQSSVLVVRIPALLCLVSVWVLCRWILARVLAASGGRSSASVWALASAFLVGALSWGMTVRPEPVSALFVTAVLACLVRFLERETVGALAITAVLTPLALSAHHAAVTALAPLVVAAPMLFRWARARVALASTIVASSIALLAVLVFVGSDLEQRRLDAAAFSNQGTTQHAWTDEIVRYAVLSDMPPLRRGSVALIALAVLAFLLRSRRGRQRLFDLPTASLGVGLVLFIVTPSKLPWHFGALLGVAAVAVALETARLRGEAARSRTWTIWPFIALVAASAAIAWSWSARRSWGVAELRTLTWTPDLPSLQTVVAALPLLLFAGAALLALARGRRERLPETPWRIASWTAPVLAVPLIAFTAGILVVDSVKADSWTLARQNLSTFTGDVGCGLADDVLVALPDSARALARIGQGERTPVPGWVPPAPVAGLERFPLGPAAEGSRAYSPWFRLREASQIGLFISGIPASGDRLELEWGRREGGEVRSLAAAEISSGYASEAAADLPWWFVAGSELPPPEAGANAVRVTVHSGETPGTPVVVTAPATYATEQLRNPLEEPASRSLVFTDVLMYLPCVRLPRLGDGIVEAPSYIVVSRDWPSPVQNPITSPFGRLFDLYRLERLPLARWTDAPRTIAVFRVDHRLPGALRAPPSRATLVS